MLQVSNAYKELVTSNIRPKCEPVIKVSGKDNNGNDVELVWKAKNIKDLTYKRGIDPIGRELPYMELTWTEIYTGKLNAQNYPEKYNNIVKYMEVELSFVQDLTFRNTWKVLFDSGVKWKDLFSKSITWKQLKEQKTQETIVLPKMFLSARPTINGQTITWVAKDLLSFVNEVSVYEFEGHKYTIPLKNAISLFLLNARGGFLNSKGLFNAYTDTVKSLLENEDISENIDKRIICNGNTKDIILNLASIYNYYFDFADNKMVLKEFNPSTISAVYKDRVLYAYPQVENSTDISSYIFKHRIAEADPESAYYREPYKITDYNGTKQADYTFRGYGEAYPNAENVTNEARLNFGSINTASKEIKNGEDNRIYVIPINYNSYDNAINIDDTGEPFCEDNPINPYDLNSEVAKARKDFLSGYFTSSTSGVSFEALPNVAVETDDLIAVDTNLYNDMGEKITKTALIVSIELAYNGTLKQKIKAHEVVL
jgi:hypothetical protein